MMAHTPKRNLGQNFLADKNMQQRIVQSCDLKSDDQVIEIGPGQGVLTRLIAPQIRKLICVEMDRDLIEPLRSNLPSSVEVVHADFLKWDMGHLGSGIKVIGNIPYYISTPIIERLIRHSAQITEAFLTVQLEFGERLTAKPGGKEYGSLTCFAQYHADIKLLFKIKNSCFKPAPKVDSCFLHLKMRPYETGIAIDEAFLFKLIQTAFQQRRKNIVNTLKGLAGRERIEAALKALNISGNARPENLTLSNYIDLSNNLMV